jgi:phosphoserine phosphatase
VQDGVYTGEPTGLFIYRSDKARAIEQLAAREGINLEQSYAYSDSESDLPMLEVVGHPVAVNPDAELRRVARERGWEILRFDRLGRRLRVSATIASAAAAGGVGATAMAARRRNRRRRWLPGRQ